MLTSIFRVLECATCEGLSCVSVPKRKPKPSNKHSIFGDLIERGEFIFDENMSQRDRTNKRAKMLEQKINQPLPTEAKTPTQASAQQPAHGHSTMGVAKINAEYLEQEKKYKKDLQKLQEMQQTEHRRVQEKRREEYLKQLKSASSSTENMSRAMLHKRQIEQIRRTRELLSSRAQHKPPVANMGQHQQHGGSGGHQATTGDNVGNQTIEEMYEDQLKKLGEFKRVQSTAQKDSSSPAPHSQPEQLKKPPKEDTPSQSVFQHQIPPFALANGRHNKLTGAY